MATLTVIVGEQPYGKERLYTTMRFVLAALYEELTVNVFLFEDAVLACRKAQQPKEMPFLLDEKMPNCEALMVAAIAQGAHVKLCGVCASERALTQHEVVDGAEITSMAALVKWVMESDKVVSF